MPALRKRQKKPGKLTGTELARCAGVQEMSPLEKKTLSEVRAEAAPVKPNKKEWSPETSAFLASAEKTPRAHAAGLAAA